MGRAHLRRRDTGALGAALAGMLVAGCPCAFALNPALDVSQYSHTEWTVRGGFAKGTIVAITQTQDGYLWLGTEFGLLRFDGVRQVPWDAPNGQNLPSSYIRSLLTAGDGRLWMGTSQGLASWKDGKLTSYPEFAGQSVLTLLEDRDGTVWAGSQAAPTARLCALRSGKTQCFGADGKFGQYVDALYEDRVGNLWAGTTAGLWRWKPGNPNLYSAPDRALGFAQTDNGALLLAMVSGIRQLVDGKFVAYSLPAKGPRIAARGVLQDHDGGLWIATTDRGLVHVHQGRTDSFERSDGLSGDFVERLFEDREGNIWVATLDGLDRFRDLAAPTISVKQGLSNATVKSVLAGTDGSVWLGTENGLNRWRDGQVTVYRKTIPTATSGTVTREPGGAREIAASGLPADGIESLFEDFRNRIWVATHRGVAYLEDGRFTPVGSVPGDVHSITGDRNGNIWINQTATLFHVRGGKVVEQIAWTGMGHPDGARALVWDPVGGGLWVAFRDGGVAYFKDGRFGATYTAREGLGEGHVRGIELDREGTFWASTEGGLSRLKDGRFITMNSKNGLPCDAVHWALEDDDHSFWLGMACALVRIERPELDKWIAAANRDPQRQVKTTVFTSSDGIRSHSTTTGYSPSVAKTADGKVWFLPWDGVSVLDPRHLPFNKLPPTVRVEQITADRKTYDANGPLRLPPLVRDLEIDYTALSLVAPEKVLFRYKLEGLDREWQDAGTRRQAFYNHLRPQQYRFRVMACNNDGVWSEAGASWSFTIAPAFYQTVWFSLVAAGALVFGLWTAYQLRVRQIAAGMNARFDERLAERSRLAAELHDTILQTVQATKMIADNARYAHSSDAASLREAVESISDWLAQATTEGRAALNALRASTTQKNDLAEAFQRAAETYSGTSSTRFVLSVEGSSRDLHPIVRDEIYRIGTEAIRNAYLHSGADNLEVSLSYAHNLIMRVRDDGRGIDPDVVTSGKPGHFGLRGMQERAIRIHGTLRLLSRLGSGTELELVVPGRTVFRESGRRPWYAKLGPLFGWRAVPFEEPSAKAEKEVSYDGSSPY